MELPLRLYGAGLATHPLAMHLIKSCKLATGLGAGSCGKVWLGQGAQTGLPARYMTATLPAARAYSAN